MAVVQKKENFLLDSFLRMFILEVSIFLFSPYCVMTAKSRNFDQF
jgi:hypothetical protein